MGHIHVSSELFVFVHMMLVFNQIQRIDENTKVDQILVASLVMLVAARKLLACKAGHSTCYVLCYIQCQRVL